MGDVVGYVFVEGVCYGGGVVYFEGDVGGSEVVFDGVEVFEGLFVVVFEVDGGKCCGVVVVD